MKLINRIKAFFTKEDKSVELDLTAAEIREGRAYLHVKGDTTTYLVKSRDIKILLNGDTPLSNEDVIQIENKEKQVKIKQENKTTDSAIHRTATGERKHESVEIDPFKKRTITFSLYPQEYEHFMLSMQEYGYKKTEYFLACVETATRGTMERAHKRIVKSHQQILRAKKAFQQSQKTEL